jgi:hypothetical protein
MSRRVSCIPSSDQAFVAAARVALGRIDARADLNLIALALGDSLRPAYPEVVVRRQQILARVTHEDVWYAYREG